MPQLFANNAFSFLNGGINSTTKSIALSNGTGARFPSPSGGDFFLLTLIGLDEAGLESVWEIVKVTGRTADTLTVVRAQEGTSAQSWLSGTRVELRVTAGSFNNLVAYALNDDDFSNNGFLKRTAKGAYTTVVDNSANWNTTYGWGNHTAPGYLLPKDIGNSVQAYSSILANSTSSFTTALKNKIDGIEAGATKDQSASEILTLLKTVDGALSGLDADKLDGVEYAAMVTAWENYADAAVAAIVDSSPAALDTLNELAAALNNDPNFSTTMATALGNRLRVDIASQSLNATQRSNALKNLGLTATYTELNYVDGVTSGIQSQLNAKQPLNSLLTNTTASFTTALKSKLDGIQAGADKTITANVAAAGAIMDSDITANGLMKRTAAGTYTSITDNSAKWNEAHVWGNHASANYAAGNHNHSGVYQPKSTVLDNTTAAFTTQLKASYDAAVGWGNHANAGYAAAGHTHTGVYQPKSSVLDNTTASFTTDLKNLYDTAHGWGNHATAGYASATHNHDTQYQPKAAVLTNTTASFTSSLKSTYDTAAGWGNHASAGYLPKSGGTLSGNLIGADNKITQIKLQDTAYVFSDSGSANTLSYTNGSVQRWAPGTGAKTLTITDWPPSGNVGELLIRGENLGAADITWPTIHWIISADGSTTTTFSENGVTLQEAGTDFVLLWTEDAGATIYGKVLR